MVLNIQGETVFAQILRIRDENKVRQKTSSIFAYMQMVLPRSHVVRRMPKELEKEPQKIPEQSNSNQLYWTQIKFC